MASIRTLSLIAMAVNGALIGCQRVVKADANLKASLIPKPMEHQNAQTSPSRFELFLHWFEGRFDNHLQVREDAEQRRAHPHQRIHSIFKAVNVPAVGENLFYVEQYGNNDPTNIYRQRLYKFSEMPNGQIRLEIAAFKDGEKRIGAHEDASKLDDLIETDLVYKAGCEVTWTWHHDHFKGQTSRGGCRVRTAAGKTLQIEDDLVLTADYISIQDRATDEHGNRVFGHPDGIPHKLIRARLFKGWAAIQDDDGKWTRTAPIETHDQGGRIPLYKPDGSPLPYELSLAQVVYSKTKTPVLKFAVSKRSADKSIAYVWVSPNSQRVGLNIRSLQSGLTLVPRPALDRGSESADTYGMTRRGQSLNELPGDAIFAAQSQIPVPNPLWFQNESTAVAQ